MAESQRANILMRIGARFVDSIIFIVVALVGGFLLDFIIDGAIFHWMNFTYFLFLVYNILLSYSKGQTFGKRICGIRLISNDEECLGFAQVFIREIVVFFILYSTKIFEILGQYTGLRIGNSDLLFTISIAFLVIDLSTLLVKDKRLLMHDMIFGTVVKNVD